MPHPSRHRIPTLLIGGTHSSVGKTSIALGLMRAFSNRGLRVQAFKVGPDFIDPGHHTLATGRRSHNLDGWMIPAAVNQQIFWDTTQDADLAIIEGVMGLFDGYGMGEMGSTAELAKLLGASVVLVIDAQGMARSAAALLQGFQRFDPQVQFLGAILNRVGSDRHRAWIQRACEDFETNGPTMEILGGLPRQEELSIPRRHLGLVLGGENDRDPGDGDRLNKLAHWVETNLDLDGLYQKATRLQAPSKPETIQPLPVPQDSIDIPIDQSINQSINIGIARDRAFCFHYEYNLNLLRQLGANLIEFSPLADKKLPDNLSGIYLAGGYPELHGPQLSHNISLCQQIATLGEQGLPIYAECGGLIYLSQTLTTKDGQTYPMVGILPFEIAMANRPTLGYREVELTSPWLPLTAIARGHCFHYSQIRPAQTESPPNTLGYAYRLQSSQGTSEKEGYLWRNVLASYVHLHWGSCPEWAQAWLQLCRNYRSDRSLAPHD